MQNHLFLLESLGANVNEKADCLLCNTLNVKRVMQIRTMSVYSDARHEYQTASNKNYDTPQPWKEHLKKSNRSWKCDVRAGAQQAKPTPL